MQQIRSLIHPPEIHEELRVDIHTNKPINSRGTKSTLWAQLFGDHRWGLLSHNIILGCEILELSAPYDDNHAISMFLSKGSQAAVTARHRGH